MGLSEQDIAAMTQAFGDREFAEAVALGDRIGSADLPRIFAAVREQGRAEATEAQARRIGEPVDLEALARWIDPIAFKVCRRSSRNQHAANLAQTRARKLAKHVLKFRPIAALLLADTKEPSDDR